jgi:dihydroxyacetone kinase DhaKLM complex PTS-EIIA-like component DhaM
VLHFIVELGTPFIPIFALFVTSCGTVIKSPLESSVHSNTTETTTISELTVPTTTNLKLEDFTNREFVGEDDNYSVYLINSNIDNENVKTGEIFVYIKSSYQIIQINGSFTVIMEGTIVYDDGIGEYIFLSIGSSPVRRAIVISLKDKKQAIQELCITSGYTEGLIFWKKNIVINKSGKWGKNKYC